MCLFILVAPSIDTSVFSAWIDSIGGRPRPLFLCIHARIAWKSNTQYIRCVPSFVLDSSAQSTIRLYDLTICVLHAFFARVLSSLLFFSSLIFFLFFFLIPLCWWWWCWAISPIQGRAISRRGSSANVHNRMGHRAQGVQRAHAQAADGHGAVGGRPGAGKTVLMVPVTKPIVR